MHKIQTLEELKSARIPMKKLVKYNESMTMIEKFAVWVTQKIGTMGFFFLLAFWTMAWLFWNIWGPAQYRFDPYPAFVLWLFISNTIQLLFLPLIMVGQNIQGRYAEARAEEDFHINAKSEKEIEAVLMHLENIEEKLDNLKR